MKLVLLVVVPAAVLIAIAPVVAPIGTLAVIWVEDVTRKIAGALLNRTEVAPVKFSPEIVTNAPASALRGLKLRITGWLTPTVKLLTLDALPSLFVTVIAPVAAPDGTTAVICVAESTVNAAGVPLNITDVAPLKPLPVIVTLAPAAPLTGVKRIPDGMETPTMKLVALVAVPADVVTTMAPVVAPLGTTAVI